MRKVFLFVTAFSIDRFGSKITSKKSRQSAVLRDGSSTALRRRYNGPSTDLQRRYPDAIPNKKMEKEKRHCGCCAFLCPLCG